jgi:hypothetical protein
MKKCFYFNSYYHINVQDYGKGHSHTMRKIVIKQRITTNFMISFSNYCAPLANQRIILIKYF